MNTQLERSLPLDAYTAKHALFHQPWQSAWIMGRDLCVPAFLLIALAQGFSYPIPQCHTLYKVIHLLSIYWAPGNELSTWESEDKKWSCDQKRCLLFLSLGVSIPQIPLEYELHLLSHLPFPPCLILVFCFKTSSHHAIYPLRAALNFPQLVAEWITYSRCSINIYGMTNLM